MRNPWLDIPLADYEAHMALPSVGQAQLLSDALARALTTYKPRSVAVLGCAGGNGFDRVATNVTQRVVGIDLNPDYVKQARARFHHRIPVLELFVGDMQLDEFSFAPVDLVFAGLLFEYVDARTVLHKTRAMLSPHGKLVTVVQLASSTIEEITPSHFTSLGALSSVMRLVTPLTLARAASEGGYQEVETHTLKSIGGKEMQVQEFRLASRDDGRNVTASSLQK